MQQIKPYKILWWTIPIIFLAFALMKFRTVDIQLYDTYFVISSLIVAILLSIIPGVLGLIYWILRNRNLNPILSLIHTIGTSLSLFGIMVLTFLPSTYSLNNFGLLSALRSIGSILLLIFLGLQLVFIVNVIIGVVMGRSEG